MYTVLSVKVSDLKKCFQELALLIPHSSKDLPVGVILQAGTLKFISMTGSVYVHSIEVEDSDSIVHLTILYHNVAVLLNTTSGFVNLEFTPNSLIVTGSNFNVEFQKGYSVVEEPSFNNIKFTELQRSGWDKNLNVLMGINMEKLYSKAMPVHFFEDITIQKYPNTWVQVRTLGFKDPMIVDSSHIKLFTHFQPTKYAMIGKDSILLCNGNSYLQLPCKENTESNMMLSMMQDLGEPVQLVLGNYVEQLRNMAKISSKTQCKITVYEKGLKTAIIESGANVSAFTGDTSTKVLKVFNLPISVWIAFLKAISSEDTIQILVGGEKLCLRNHSMIILTRVLL